MGQVITRQLSKDAVIAAATHAVAIASRQLAATGPWTGRYSNVAPAIVDLAPRVLARLEIAEQKLTRATEALAWAELAGIAGLVSEARSIRRCLRPGLRPLTGLQWRPRSSRWMRTAWRQAEATAVSRLPGLAVRSDDPESAG